MPIVRPHDVTDRCLMPPSPRLRRLLQERFRQLQQQAGELLAPRLRLREQARAGFNDGLLLPGTRFPLGTPASMARRQALERNPLRGKVRVLVVLVDFPDAELPPDARERFERLFFSTGRLEHGSVREYYADVTRKAVRIDGEVIGPFRLPISLASYVGRQNGTQTAEPNARTMADDALTALLEARPDGFDLTAYDNDDNGFVDAFIVVHAGRGAEESGQPGDIWSHKWVLPVERSAGGAKVYGYLTIPQDARLGVCAHELGHLLFAWPDLYDPDYSSSGIGDFCLMAAGSWGLNGDRPVHPSAWCKASQNWVNVNRRHTNRTVTIKDVKDTGTVHRLWRDGAPGTEYFLLENRQRAGYDASLPAGGLLIWHIDDAVDDNSDERHYRVGLMQADGKNDLEAGSNDGDDGDPWPGSSGATRFDDGSTPSSRSHADRHTCVAVEEISSSGGSMKARLQVRCTDPTHHPTG